MGLFVVETKSNWDRVIDAMKTWRRKIASGNERTLYDEKDEHGKTQARRHFEELEAEVKEALAPVRIDVNLFWNHVAKLLMANNLDLRDAPVADRADPDVREDRGGHLRDMWRHRRDGFHLRHPVPRLLNVVVLLVAG